MRSGNCSGVLIGEGSGEVNALPGSKSKIQAWNVRFVVSGRNLSARRDASGRAGLRISNGFGGSFVIVVTPLIPQGGFQPWIHLPGEFGLHFLGPQLPPPDET